MSEKQSGLEYTEVEEEDSSSIEEIKNPFDPKKIDIDTKSITIDLLIKRLSVNPPEIDLYPKFQRKGGIWSNTKQSRLIESILIRLPLPAFYFDGTDDNNWLVVDGLQRLWTLKNFVIEQNQNLKLQNMEFLTVLNGKTFKELPREFQRRIEETQITAYIIKPGTPTSVKFNIFQRINTGGEPLTAQEIRHALNQGIPAQFIESLAKLESFKKVTNNIKPDRMLDRDFVTRFISFFLTSHQDYKPELDAFLNEGMNKLKDLSEEEQNRIRNAFDLSMTTAFKLFGKHAFRKRISKDQVKRKPLNKALFEVWSVSLAKLSKDEVDLLVKRKNDLNKFVIALTNNVDFHNAISQSTGDRKRVIKRFSEVEQLIKETLE